MEIGYYTGLISRHIPSLEIRTITPIQKGWVSIVLDMSPFHELRFALLVGDDTHFNAGLRGLRKRLIGTK